MMGRSAAPDGTGGGPRVTGTSPRDSTLDATPATGLDAILDQLRASDASEAIDALIAAHPERASEIRQLVAVLRLARQVGQTESASVAAEARFGDFRLIRELGRGGMGVVYLAEQVSLKRMVALKVLLPGVRVWSHAIERFQREARAAGGLHHAHIVPVYASGEQDGMPYFAMQHIDGVTLSDEIAERRRAGRAPQGAEFRRLARIAAQVADALDHAHRLGVIHRDVKPSNILIDRDDNAWVMDFGLARVDAAAALTLSHDLVGTVRYMSPEQARGGGRVDERSDVYSLGVTLFEMAALRPPFDAPDRESALRQVLLDPLPSLRSQNRATPPDFDAIVLCAAARDPEDRYASAALLADDLRCFAEGRALRSRPRSLLAQSSRLVRRHPRIAAFLAAALLLSAGFGAAMSVLYARAEQHRQSAERGQTEAAEATRREAELRSTAQQQLAKSQRVQQFLRSMFTTLSPESGHDAALLFDMLDEAGRRADAQAADVPAAAAAIHEIIAEVYARFGRAEKAREHAERAASCRDADRSSSE